MAKRPARKSPTSRKSSRKSTARTASPRRTRPAGASRAKGNSSTGQKKAAKSAPGRRPVKTRTAKANAKVTPVKRKAVPRAPQKAAATVTRASGTKQRAARSPRTFDAATIPTPPSSLDMRRRGSAARTGRAEIREHQADHANLTPSITAGDVDVNVENAYFSGDEAPGGDNPTPDQDIVDDIGKALGVEYQDDEELQSGDKVAQRDRHRWELDPASAEDYRDRVQGEEKAQRGRRRRS